MFRSNCRTTAGQALGVADDRLTLNQPEGMYKLPHPDGGLIALMVFVDEPAIDPGGCCTEVATASSDISLEDYEVIAYSGYEADGVTLIITGRGQDETTAKAWDAGVMVVQTVEYNSGMEAGRAAAEEVVELKEDKKAINGLPVLTTSVGFNFINPADDSVLAGGKIYTYEVGTTTPKTTWTAEDQLTENTNPIILNAAGYADIAIDGEYKFLVADSSDVVIDTVEPVTSVQNLIADIYTAAKIKELYQANDGVLGALDFLTKAQLENYGPPLKLKTARIKFEEHKGIYDWIEDATEGINPSGNVGSGRWVRSMPQEVITLSSFGAGFSGDDTQNIKDAVLLASSSGKSVLVDVVARYTEQIVIPDFVRIIGSGISTAHNVLPKAYFLKDFDGVGFLFSGDNCETDNVHYHSVQGRGGDNVVVTGERWRAPSISSQNAGGDGVRIGLDELINSSINTNLWSIGFIASINNTGDGLKISHVNTSIEASWPRGIPNCNAGTLTSLDSRNNGGNGLTVGNTIDNHFGNVVCQNNVGRGVEIEGGGHNNVISKCYTESNQGGEGLINSGAYQNIITASRWITAEAGWDNQGGPSNLIYQHTDAIEGDYKSSIWTLGESLFAKAKGVSSKIGAYLQSGASAFIQIEESSTGTGSRMSFWTKRDGDTAVKRVEILPDGTMVFTNSAGILLGKEVPDTTTAGIHLGNVGSGSNTRIDMVGNGTAYDTKFGFYNGGGYVGGIITENSSTSYTTTSDYRLKENVSELDKALDVIMKLKPSVYNFKTQPHVKFSGFIAHELQQHVPEAVAGNKDGKEMQSVDLSKVIPYLVKAVQELNEIKKV